MLVIMVMIKIINFITYKKSSNLMLEGRPFSKDKHTIYHQTTCYVINGDANVI